MKILVDNKEVCSLSDTKKKVLMSEISSDIFEEDMCRRVNWVIMHKHEQCMKRLREEWMPKLKKAGLESIPLDDDKFAELVFSQPDYKDKKAKEVI